MDSLKKKLDDLIGQLNKIMTEIKKVSVKSIANSELSGTEPIDQSAGELSRFDEDTDKDDSSNQFEHVIFLFM